MSELALYASSVLDAYRRNLAESGRPTRRDYLRGTAEYYVRVDEQTIHVGLDLAAYWRAVEKGTDPHAVPLDALREWIRMKPVVPMPDRNGRVPSIRSLAYLIGRKIAREGTQGTHDLERATAEVGDGFRERLRAAVEADVKRNVTIMLTNI